MAQLTIFANCPLTSVHITDYGCLSDHAKCANLSEFGMHFSLTSFFSDFIKGFETKGNVLLIGKKCGLSVTNSAQTAQYIMPPPF